MADQRKSASGYYEHQPNPGGFVSDLSFRVRRKMLSLLMEITGAGDGTTVLDVGVTNDRRKESNFLEKLYPWPETSPPSGWRTPRFSKTFSRGSAT